MSLSGHARIYIFIYIHIYIYIFICIYIYIFIYIYRQYATEEGHRRVRMLWSSYYRFIGLECHSYALYLCFVDK